MLAAGFDPLLVSGAGAASGGAALTMPAGRLRSEAAVDSAAKEFESLFISQMLEHLFADVRLGTDGQQDDGSFDIYRTMLVGEYGKLITQSGGIGVADYVKREMLRAQEVGS